MPEHNNEGGNHALVAMSGHFRKTIKAGCQLTSCRNIPYEHFATLLLRLLKTFSHHAENKKHINNQNIYRDDYPKSPAAVLAIHKET